jgi:sucrose phosphorylase
VVRALLRLIRFRNSHPAFAGEFAVEAGVEDGLALTWRHGEARARLDVGLSATGKAGVPWRLTCSSHDGTAVLTPADLLRAP